MQIMQEMTFAEFSRDANRIYKKNCAVYYKLASHYGLTETMFDIHFILSVKMRIVVPRPSFVIISIYANRQ